MIVCDLLSAGKPEAIETAIDICIARYKLCEHLLLKHLSKIMRSYGIRPIDRLPEPGRIIDVISEKVKEKIGEETSNINEIGSVVRRRVVEQSTRIVIAALYATLGSLGVDCNLG